MDSHVPQWYIEVSFVLWGELIRSWKAIQIQIWHVILMVGNLHQVSSTLLQGELCHGSQDCRGVLHYPQQKLSVSL